MDGRGTPDTHSGAHSALAEEVCDGPRLRSEGVLLTHYLFTEVDSIDPNVAAVLHRFNSLSPETFPPLQSRHLLRGHWWLVHYGGELVAFAGMVPLEPFAGVGYLKRAYVLPQHRGHGSNSGSCIRGK
jgi:hypothetical protein